MLIKQCTICKRLKITAEFQSKIRPTICNNCNLEWIPPDYPKPKRDQGKGKEVARLVRENITSFFDYYNQFPHVDFSRIDSLVLYTQIKSKNIYYRYIDYQNKKYKPEKEFTPLSIKYILEKVGPHIWRYITHKQCRDCLRYFPTYDGADDPNFVTQVLSDSTLHPTPINFSVKRFKIDRRADFCTECEPAAKARSMRCVPWLRGTKHDPRIKNNPDSAKVPIDKPN